MKNLTPLDFKNLDIIDVIGEVVDSMRVTGTYSGSFDGTYTTCTVDNTLKVNAVIIINSVEYKVTEAASTYFKVKGDVSAFTTYKTAAPYYEYGTAREVADTLSKKDTSTQILAFKKYPLIWLQLDVSSDYNQTFQQFDYNDLRIYIVNFTKPEYKAKDRKTVNFEPILHPLYVQFIKALRLNKNIAQRNNIPYIAHRKFDRYFWGSQFNDNNTKNIFNDYLDAIDIQNLNISIKNLIC